MFSNYLYYSSSDKLYIFVRAYEVMLFCYIFYSIFSIFYYFYFSYESER